MLPLVLGILSLVQMGETGSTCDRIVAIISTANASRTIGSDTVFREMGYALTSQGLIEGWSLVRFLRRRTSSHNLAASSCELVRDLLGSITLVFRGT